MRSKLFRSLVVENLDQLLSLSVGFRRNLPLPAPPAVASVLRSKSIEFLEKWNASFGIHYRQLRLGFDYLKNTLRFQFPDLQANAARIQQERREREMRSKEILLNKFETLQGNFSSIKDEIWSTIDEIGECLDILRTKDESMPLNHLEDEDTEEFHFSELRQIRLDSLKEGDKVHEDSDNKVVFDALRELYKLLVTKHIVSVQEWISVLIRVEVEDNRLRDSMLKEFIDIRNHLRLIKKECEESGCALPNSIDRVEEEDEEDFWEEGKIEAYENGESSVPNNQNNNLATASTSKEVNNTEVIRNEGQSSSSVRSKLIAEAPVVKWGSYLDNWGSNRDILANQRGLELEGHWGRVDYDAVIPAEKIAELNVQTTIYKEEHVEIQPCRAPLRKGGLCERRDLKVCPFHGPIIPRDKEGNPINQNSSSGEKSLKASVDDIVIEPHTNLVDELVKQAVKNVRERDREEEMKNKNDKRLLKRAKLAKVREHNEAVLREAALATTSRSASIGEVVEGYSGRSKLTKTNRQTLASMLRKKVTPKDRLSQRLLNTRVRDATTRQLTLGEDASYREAFPNQW